MAVSSLIVEACGSSSWREWAAITRPVSMSATAQARALTTGGVVTAAAARKQLPFTRRSVAVGVAPVEATARTGVGAATAAAAAEVPVRVLVSATTVAETAAADRVRRRSTRLPFRGLGQDGATSPSPPRCAGAVAGIERKRVFTLEAAKPGN